MHDWKVALSPLYTNARKVISNKESDVYLFQLLAIVTKYYVKSINLLSYNDKQQQIFLREL